MTVRKRERERVEAALPRDDAPEHPLDPADAAFLDPASAGLPATPVPTGRKDDASEPPGYGDFEGERSGDAATRE